MACHSKTLIGFPDFDNAYHNQNAFTLATKCDKLFTQGADKHLMQC